MIEVMAKLLTRCVELVVVDGGGGEVILADVTIALGKLVAWKSITPSDELVGVCMYLHNRVVRPLESLLVRRLPISPSPLFPFDHLALAAAGAPRLVGRGGQPAPSTGRRTSARPRPPRKVSKQTSGLPRKLKLGMGPLFNLTRSTNKLASHQLVSQKCHG